MTTPLAVAPDPLAALTPIMRWLLERASPDEPALEGVRPELTLETLYNTWLIGGQAPSAIRLIAAVLPARESIWWAWVSARHATQMSGGKAPTAAMHTALTAIEQWIVRPDDEARRAAWAAGEAAGLDTTVGLVALAVFLNGTSIVPANQPAVPPPPGAAMPIIGGVVLMAAAANSDPEQIVPTQLAFAAQGLEIVKRLGGWDAALQLAYSTHQRQLQEYTHLTQPAPAR